MRLIALLLLLMFAGTASATDYYLATTGDNGNNGESIAQAWLTPTYAVQQLSSGDTLWVVDGTYVSSTTIELEANQFGTASSWTRIKAYNGTPVWDGNSANVDGFLCGESSDTPYTQAYVELDGIHIKRFNITEICMQYVCDIVIKNCIFANSSVALPTWRSLMKIGNAMYNITIDNCTFSDGGNFGIDLMGDRNTGTLYPMFNVTISNCDFDTIINHAGIQIGDYTHNITVADNTFTNCYGGVGTHYHEVGNVNLTRDITIKNNTFNGITAGYAISAMKTEDSIFENNTIYNCVSGNKAGFALTEFCNNITVKDNTVEWVLHAYDDAHSGDLYDMPNGLIVYENNTLVNITAEIGDGGTYYQRAGGKLYIRDSDHFDASGDSTKYGIYLKNDDGEGNATIEKTNGKVFSYEVISGASYWLNMPQWYPTLGNMSFGSAEDAILTVEIIDYNITLVPTNPYLKNVSVNRESNSTYDITNVSVNSSVATNPTTITATMQNASNTYNVSVDGVYTIQVVSNAAKVVTYQYSAAWSQHTFEFKWFSDAGWSPSNTAMYYNTSSPIQITTKIDGTNLFSRTPTQTDGNATSGRLVVKTS
jgi:hypothetical protein